MCVCVCVYVNHTRTLNHGDCDFAVEVTNTQVELLHGRCGRAFGCGPGIGKRSLHAIVVAFKWNLCPD